MSIYDFLSPSIFFEIFYVIQKFHEVYYEVVFFVSCMTWGQDTSPSGQFSHL